MTTKNTVSTLAPVQQVRTKPSKRHPSNESRFCSHKGCSVKLSIYNLSSYCSPHERLNAQLSDLL